MEESTIKNIDQMIGLVNKYKLPIFDEHFERRSNENEVNLANHNELLRHLVILVVYSQQARSKSVGKVIDSGALDNAFLQFNVSEVSKLNPCDVVEEHWQDIKGIRQQTKVFQVVMLARKIPEISDLLVSSCIPKHIKTSTDLEAFWIGFGKLKKEFKNNSVPFFRETTSLLHLLTSLGYDCIKPDSAVLKAARKLEFLYTEKKPNDKELIQVVKTIQSYSIHTQRVNPPPVLDLYLLVHGEQTEASDFVASAYYKTT
ncbi:hypothetical protein OMR72_004584 [Vibrio parahaemolyticus]|uniref:hypothetical protein n=2 Tax=Vibrio parahaemolyticus TaxID=670 RepID=UPI001124AED3|nr:hypothetical protein [Vibrio parahaemolyticus]EGQ8541443.1 hypothetical protein [Vibrio parahaemolyticus]EIJ2225990.1 hypothetical protein [Vibrio parahaemolyticus]EJG1014281.1 hypothetical protein [Vibrio parahaemolyticus]EJG1843250.1 hypothetical protein [Vibrio parahaemolyticus]EKA8936272.1 hypothetical protein [Vibrio parahaemolyticus]